VTSPIRPRSRTRLDHDTRRLRHDIGTYIAQKMGVKARFDNTGFDGIIAALLAKKCDAVIFRHERHTRAA